MFSIKLGARFEISSQYGDLLIRIGKRQFFRERGAGWIAEAVK
jgi:hypothetical protein